MRLLACSIILAAARGSAAEPRRPIAVAVAANLKPAFEEIAARFEATRPGVAVRATYGSSGNFLAQIVNGAPFDLFLSADGAYPAQVVERGLADGEAFTYARGRLAAWVPNGSKLDLEAKGLAALLDPSVRKVAIANPKVAPYGRAAVTALERAGVHERLADRLVIGENVAQAAQFAESGNAQAALVPLSLARSPPLATAGRAWVVPASAHDPIAQAGVVLRGARDPSLALDLAAFVAGPAAREILARYGYDPPSR